MSFDFVYVSYIYYFFFVSSRRRHTRYWRDWSSDVCSSDLEPLDLEQHEHGAVALRQPREGAIDERARLAALERFERRGEIGRASCRERVEMWLGDGRLKKMN